MSFRPKKPTLIIFTVIGIWLLGVGTYFLISRTMFLRNSEAYEAPIVEVSHERVRKGKTSVMAYVPIVEVPQGRGAGTRLKVDDFDEEPNYAIGERLRVVCNLNQGCIKDTFMGRWWSSIFYWLLSLLFLSPLLYFQFVYKRAEVKSQGRSA